MKLLFLAVFGLESAGFAPKQLLKRSGIVFALYIPVALGEFPQIRVTKRLC
jgi:hypothetical protein